MITKIIDRYYYRKLRRSIEIDDRYAECINKKTLNPDVKCIRRINRIRASENKRFDDYEINKKWITDYLNKKK